MSYFDNGPIQRMLEEVSHQVRQLNFDGVEVLEVRLNGFKATIRVPDGAPLAAEYQEGDFMGYRRGSVHVLWRGNEGNGE